MATPLSELQRRFFDRMDEGSSQYVTAQQALDCINEAYSQLWGIYSRASPYLFESEFTISPAIGVRDYALPANFRQLIQAYAVPAVGGGQLISLRQFGRREYIGLQQNFDTFFTAFSVPTYLIIGQNLRLDPVPNTAQQYTIVLWYRYHYTPLVNPTDTLDSAIYPGHEQWIINQAVIQLKIGKEEQPATDLQAANTIIQNNIIEDLKQRDIGSAKPVLDSNAYSGWV